MRINNLIYFFEEAIANIKNSILINLITIGIITISLLIFGLFSIIFVNLNSIVDRLSNKIQMTVFIYDNLSEVEISETKEKIYNIEGVQETTFVSKEDALEKFKERGFEDILNGFDSNPLPASFDIKIKKDFCTTEKIAEIVNKLSKIEEIEEIQSGQKFINHLMIIISFFRFGGLIVGGLISVAVIFIIANTIKLTIYMRREELEIMRLVGATNWFIKWPFIIEGLLQGLSGAVFSVILLYGIYKVVISGVNLPPTIKISLSSISFIPSPLVFGIVIGGLILGSLGSLLSLNRFLKI